MAGRGGPFGFGLLGGKPTSEDLSGVTSEEGKLLASAMESMRTEMKAKDSIIGGLQTRLSASEKSVSALSTSLSAANTTINSQKTTISGLQKQVNDAWTKLNVTVSDLATFKNLSLGTGEIFDIRALVKVFASSPINTTKVNNLASLVDPGNFSPLKSMLDTVKSAGGITKVVDNTVTKGFLTGKLGNDYVKPDILTGILNGTSTANIIRGVVNKQHVVNLGFDGNWVRGWVPKSYVEGLGFNKDWVNGFTSGFVDFNFIKGKGFTPWSTVKDKISRITDTDNKLNDVLIKTKAFHTKMTEHIAVMITKNYFEAGVPDQDILLEGDGPIEFFMDCSKKATYWTHRSASQLRLPYIGEMIAKEIMGWAKIKGAPPFKDGMTNLKNGLIGSDEKGGLRQGIANTKSDLGDMKTA